MSEQNLTKRRDESLSEYKQRCLRAILDGNKDWLEANLEYCEFADAFEQCLSSVPHNPDDWQPLSEGTAQFVGKRAFTNSDADSAFRVLSQCRRNRRKMRTYPISREYHVYKFWRGVRKEIEQVMSRSSTWCWLAADQFEIWFGLLRLVTAYEQILVGRLCQTFDNPPPLARLLEQCEPPRLPSSAPAPLQLRANGPGAAG